ncbi:DUF960 family protein [Sediminibacillus halophilus]|uniref:Uncharacterized protein n=1 Tax=Sediminibacillus halophilus TaxID=482461 RepID=A0A1G9T4C9_9BACI|nr:DUF960 family protein [Sediminibacillus halophilus]SDM42583.1 protein of unknown function [Sediminibacillus halophilus]
MPKKHKSRYMTKAISEEVNVELKMLLWGVMDLLASERKETMDYLQVFDIIVSDNKLRMTNKQEQSYLKEEFINKRGNINKKP